jgi:hypothetical protein
VLNAIFCTVSTYLALLIRNAICCLISSCICLFALIGLCLILQSLVCKKHVYYLLTDGLRNCCMLPGIRTWYDCKTFLYLCNVPWCLCLVVLLAHAFLICDLLNFCAFLHNTICSMIGVECSGCALKLIDAATNCLCAHLPCFT